MPGFARAPSHAPASRQAGPAGRLTPPRGEASRDGMVPAGFHLADLPLLPPGRGPAAAAVQRYQRPARPKHGGLPAPLKAGVEALSGVAMDEVRVRYRSPEPARLGALAFARGRDIHLGPGQEHHLPHEAWHVAQQALGRVKPTREMSGAAINDDSALEREADISGRAALQPAALRRPITPKAIPSASAPKTMQLQWWDKLKKAGPVKLGLGGGLAGAAVGGVVGGPWGAAVGGLIGAVGGAVGGWLGREKKGQKFESMSDMWKSLGVDENEVNRVIAKEPLLGVATKDISDHIGRMRFKYKKGEQPAADPQPEKDGTYNIISGRRHEQKSTYRDKHRFTSAILHEMMHVAAVPMYGTNKNPPGTMARFANIVTEDPSQSAAPTSGSGQIQYDATGHDPQGYDRSGYDQYTGFHRSQFGNNPLSVDLQKDTMDRNWEKLSDVADVDFEEGRMDENMRRYINDRAGYASNYPANYTHYDTVLTDMMYYMNANDKTNHESYRYMQRMLADANERRSGRSKTPVAAI